MATFAYTYTIANGQKADAVPVQQNLNDARTFMLASCWHTDGVNGFSQNCSVAQNTKSAVYPALISTAYRFDTVTTNAFNIWQGSTNPTQFKCGSTGFYAITLDDYKLNLAESGQIGAYYALQNVTTGLFYWRALAGPTLGSGGVEWLVYLTLNDIFTFYAYPNSDCYVESASVGVCQVGR